MSSLTTAQSNSSFIRRILFYFNSILFAITLLTTTLLPSHSQAEGTTFSSLSEAVAPASQQTTFLPKEEAFIGAIEHFNNELVIQWEIADEYYLYHKRFKFSVPEESQVTLSEPQYSRKGKIKDDEIFGVVEVFYNTVTITLPYTSPTDQKVELTVGYQGCAEAGLCYPPSKLKKVVHLKRSKESKESGNPTTTTNSSLGSSTNGNHIESNKTDSSNAKSKEAVDKSSASSLASYLENASLLPILGVFFLLGIGLTFTPCVLPMIPILSGVILGQKEQLTPARGFLLSSSYVLGMALAFSGAGLLVGVSGARIQLFMQDPIVLSVFAFIFVLLSLAMFGFYELQLPGPLRDKLDSLNSKQKGGDYIGVFIMGILSALVVSPCVSAPLAGILIYIASEGSALLGALALLALGLGMGAPLVVIGTTGANILPKAGSWMNATKAVFGVALLAVAIYLVRTVLHSTVMMLLWAGLLIIPAIYMGALEPIESTANGWKRFWKGVAIILLVYGVALIWGAAQGNSNPLKPLQPSFTASTVAIGNTGLASSAPTLGPSKLPFKTVTTNSDLTTALNQAKQAKQPAMIDFYADWCIACVEMEHGAFADARTINQLAPFTLIKVDITDGGDEANALLDRFKLIGPPSILFFDKTGQRVASGDIMGEMNTEQFLQHLNTHVLTHL